MTNNPTDAQRRDEMKTLKKLAQAAAVFTIMSLMIGGAACLIAGAPVWLGAVIVAAYWLI